MSRDCITCGLYVVWPTVLGIVYKTVYVRARPVRRTTRRVYHIIIYVYVIYSV